MVQGSVPDPGRLIDQSPIRNLAEHFGAGNRQLLWQLLLFKIRSASRCCGSVNIYIGSGSRRSFNYGSGQIPYIEHLFLNFFVPLINRKGRIRNLRIYGSGSRRQICLRIHRIQLHTTAATPHETLQGPDTLRVTALRTGTSPPATTATRSGTSSRYCGGSCRTWRNPPNARNKNAPVIFENKISRNLTVALECYFSTVPYQLISIIPAILSSLIGTGTVYYRFS